MKIDHTIINFSGCDDNLPQGEFTGYESTDPKDLFAAANDNYTTGRFFVALDDTGESEKNGQGPYYLYLLDGSESAMDDYDASPSRLD